MTAHADTNRKRFFFRCVTRRPATGRPGCLLWHSEFRRQSWFELKLRFSDSCGFHCSGLRCASLGLRPVRTNSLPKSGFLDQLCRTGVLPEVPLERPCSPGIRPNAGSRAAWTFSPRHPVPNYYPRNRCSRRTQQSGASASGSASQAINHHNPDQSAHKHRSRFGDRS